MSMPCVGLPSNVRPRSGQPCSPLLWHPLRGLLPSVVGGYCAGRAICASFAPLGVYIYAVGDESCTTRLPLLRSVPLTDPNRGRAWHPREFGAVLGVSASLPLPAPPLPSSSRRYAPQCFVGGYTSSPCDVSHRASDEPRRRMSLSSALAPSSLASPSIRRVFLRCICARRRLVSSLNLARVSPYLTEI